MKRVHIFILVLLLAINFSASAFASNHEASHEKNSTITFADVDAASDIGAAIYEMVEAGIINGYPNGTFQPEKGLKRSEACKIINLEFGFTEQDTSGFSDVASTDWYAEHAYISRKTGYITGYPDGTFKQGNLIKRQEVCTILVRIFKRFDLEIKLGPIPVSVSDTIPDWAKDDVYFVLSNGFMLTDPDGRFRATEPITRAEFCSLFAQFLDVAENTNGESENSGIPAPGDDNTTPEEETVLASIQSVYAGLQSSQLIQRVSSLNPVSRQIVSSISSCLGSVLDKSAAGQAITSEFVSSTYVAEINAVKSLYASLTEAQKTSLQSALLSYLSMADIHVLKNYFFS